MENTRPENTSFSYKNCDPSYTACHAAVEINDLINGTKKDINALKELLHVIEIPKLNDNQPHSLCNPLLYIKIKRAMNLSGIGNPGTTPELIEMLKEVRKKIHSIFNDNEIIDKINLIKMRDFCMKLSNCLSYNKNLMNQYNKHPNQTY